tara:strand:- start:629 stop:877 length:249 start_codon:yes stop_codon:yes gene_type:complete
MFAEVCFPPPAMKHSINVELALHNLGGSRMIQPMAQHQPLDTVYLDKALNRFFHAISKFGFGETQSIWKVATHSFGTQKAEL